MLRTALKPRWLALLVVALLAATGMAALGQWQLNRAREHSRAERVAVATSRPAVELTSLLTPRETFTNEDADRPVTATGTWDGAHQLLVADRYLAGRPGLWVLTPLVLADGSAVAVVRGWVPSAGDPAASAAALPTGPVSLSGVIRPPEPPVDRAPGETSGLPAGQLDGVDLTQLIRLWPQKLIVGYVVLVGQQPAPAAGPALVPPTAPSNTAVAWQNLSYALQWFAFAGFGLFMWYRLVRDDHRGRLPGGPGRGPSGPGGDTPDGPSRPGAPAPATRGAQP